MHNPPHRSAVTAFAAEPTSATAARRFVRQTLTAADITQSLCDRAELIVSELVTNAVLHAGTGPVVSVRIDARTVRIEVEDTSPTAPVLREYGLDASTGRGLRVVSSAASEWGVETTSQGKAVWATLFVLDEAKDNADIASAPHITHKNQGPDSPNALDRLASEPTTQASFRNIPLRLYMQLEAHNESLVREFSLLAIQVEGDEEHLMPEALRDAVLLSTKLDMRFTLLRVGARTAVREERDAFSMTVDMTRASVDSLESYVRWARLADGLSSQNLLLTAPPLESVRYLREWLVREAVAQIANGNAPSPYNEHAFKVL